MKVNAIITQLMQITGSITKSQLADKLGTTPQSICNWERRGSIPFLSASAIQKVLPAVNVLWLTGQSEQILADAEPKLEQMRQAPVQRPRAEEHRMYEALEVRDLTAMCGTADLPDGAETLEPVQVPWPGVKYVITCEGDSMMPRVCDGDKVYVGEPLGRFERLREDVLYLVVTRTQVMVKYLEDPGMDVPYLQMKCHNPDYVMENKGRLMKEEVRQIYKVKIVVNFQD